ncbi:MAG TPA: RNA polymerase sigma-70 factor [Longimicrobiales bacterium]
MANPNPLQRFGPEWIERIRGGDEAAFEALFRTFAPWLCTFVARYVGSRAAAEDLVQDLFLALWKNRSELRIERSVSTYLFNAAKNRALNYLRNEQTREWFRAALLERSDLPSTIDESEILELLDVQKAIEDLPPRCRLIFTLNRQQGLTYDEIADSLGLSIKTVETQMGRALKALRAKLLSFRHS